MLDLGAFPHPDEPLAMALSVLGDLWNRRAQGRPMLIVIDEAHTLCSPGLETALGRGVREQIIQIAADGRKFGLWMLLSTQRPSKIHPNQVAVRQPGAAEDELAVRPRWSRVDPRVRPATCSTRRCRFARAYRRSESGIATSTE